MSVTIFVDFAIIAIALKLAELSGALKFDGWISVLGATLVCWVSPWPRDWLLLATDAQKLVRGPVQIMGLQLATEVLVTMVLLLIAWAVVPGAHVRRFSGLLIASIVMVGFRFVGTMWMAQMLVGA